MNDSSLAAAKKIAFKVHGEQVDKKTIRIWRIY